MVEAKKLPCGHILHLHCLRSWLERAQICPICRTPVLQEEIAPNPPPPPQQVPPQVPNQGGMNPPFVNAPQFVRVNFRAQPAFIIPQPQNQNQPQNQIPNPIQNQNKNTNNNPQVRQYMEALQSLNLIQFQLNTINEQVLQIQQYLINNPPSSFTTQNQNSPSTTTTPSINGNSNTTSTTSSDMMEDEAELLNQALAMSSSEFIKQKQGQTVNNSSEKEIEIGEKEQDQELSGKEELKDSSDQNEIRRRRLLRFSQQ